MVSKVKRKKSDVAHKALIKKLHVAKANALAMANLTSIADLNHSEAIAILNNAMKVEADMKALRKEAMSKTSIANDVLDKLIIQAVDAKVIS